ncbi:hypothetical protein K432DRAFT_445888 [Lepidopterella palustris CBS 459.81]|uniref:Uncharacterized protein n=1 Tax=Lepidopterella palustris CBS 459.81 TaxID=1314670 RepID=A0A8E2JBP7_9PEZI|nr:hypothetical protein K432DRAFT_445888 [Lepidopterella palustris CBS 459.81]
MESDRDKQVDGRRDIKSKHVLFLAMKMGYLALSVSDVVSASEDSAMMGGDEGDACDGIRRRIVGLSNIPHHRRVYFSNLIPIAQWGTQWDTRWLRKTLKKEIILNRNSKVHASTDCALNPLDPKSNYKKQNGPSVNPPTKTRQSRYLRHRKKR